MFMDNALKTKLMKKFKYDKDIYGDMSNFEMIIEDLIEASKHIALSLKYPFLEDYSNIKVPTKYQNWQYRCCIELHKLAGKEGIISYSENGLSWSKLTDGLPKSLLEEIIPRVGVPKKDILEESNNV